MSGTQQAFSVTLSKTTRDLGVWAGKTGGESTRDSTDYYPGAMRPARKTLATPTTSDIVIRKTEGDLSDVDIAELYHDLTTDAELICVRQRLTAIDRPVGAPKTYRCVVTDVAPADVDSASTDEAELQVTLSVFGLPTLAA